MSRDWAEIISEAVGKVDEGALNVLTASQLALDFDANRGEINDAIGALVPTDPRIDAVRALHWRAEDGDDVLCGEDGDAWPCPTIRALDGAQ